MLVSISACDCSLPAHHNLSVDFVKCFGAAGGLHNELSASVVESLVNDVLGYIKALGYSDFDSILRKIFHSALPTGKIYLLALFLGLENEKY